MGEHERSRKEIQMTNKYLGKMSITRIKSQLKLDVSLSFHFFSCRIVKVKNKITFSITQGTTKQALQYLPVSLKILATFSEGGWEICLKSFTHVESRNA